MGRVRPRRTLSHSGHKIGLNFRSLGCKKDIGVLQMRDIQRLDNRIFQRPRATELLMRLADLLIACTLLVITLPLMTIVALVIKCESPGPILDRQTCIGRSGRRFQMLKFRTAVHYPYRAIPPWAPVPTQIGQILWRTRLEVLPQLIHVLRGEMSIIDRERGARAFLD